MGISQIGRALSSEFVNMVSSSNQISNVKRVSIERGFTFIEIIIVCVLIGVISSLAIANLVVTNDSVARAEAVKFVKYIDYLKEESLLSGKQMAIAIDGSGRGFGNDSGKSSARSGYRFYVYTKAWVEIEDPLLSPSIYPEKIEIIWSVSSGDSDRIIVDPMGMVSDFFVSFIGKNRRFDVALSEELEVIISKKSLDDSWGGS